VEVIQVGTAPAFASVSEALDMVQAGLSYLAAADAAQLPAATQAECLRRLERSDAIATAARAFILAGFTARQGYADDADYSAVAWLIHQTRITRGAAGHAAWAGRVATHAQVLAALAAGQVTASVGRLICLWTGKLPEKYRDDADEVLIAAAAAGLGLEDLAALFAEMYQRARSELPDQDPDRDFEDRSVKLATTFGGAGVLHGDLTPECTEMVGRVLDGLAAPVGKDDDRTKDQRYHDALHEAMKRLVASGLLPERAGNPVKAWAHISLADLLLLDGDSALQEEWTAQVRAGGPRAGRSPPRPAARAAPGWTGKTPRPSPATPPWPPSSPATSTSTPWKTWSGSASSWTPGGTAGGMPPGRRWSRRSSAKPSIFYCTHISSLNWDDSDAGVWAPVMRGSQSRVSQRLPLRWRRLWDTRRRPRRQQRP
jgi:hypothetical protein